MPWTSWIGLTLALLVLVLVGLKAYGASRWNALTRALMGRLEAARTPTQPARYDASELAGLPPPVQRYFRTALPAGGPIITSATAEHTGSFNVSETSEQWKPFSSTQNITTRPPGFVWDARVAILPGLAVHVHDAYVAGEGILHPAILGLFTIVALRGTPELAQSELMRFFAEALCYPTALLPSRGIRWEGVDARCARATLVAGGLTLLFRFGEDGLIESARAEARGRTVDHRVVPTTWEGRWWNYQERSAMRVPMTGEAAWLLPEGRKPYWRGTITSLTYEFMECIGASSTSLSRARLGGAARPKRTIRPWAADCDHDDAVSGCYGGCSLRLRLAGNFSRGMLCKAGIGKPAGALC